MVSDDLKFGQLAVALSCMSEVTYLTCLVSSLLKKVHAAKC